MGINELAAATSMKRNPLELLLGRMVKDALIKRTGSGRYAHKDYVEPPKESPDKGKSVRSVSVSGQIKKGSQATEFAQKREDICPSVRSVQEFTSKVDLAAEHVKSRTDQTDGQIGTQGAEGKANSDFANLSDPQTDRTDDDLTIPECLDQRPRCAQCNGRPDGSERSLTIEDNTIWLHPECQRFFRPSGWSFPHNAPMTATGSSL